MNSEEIIVKSHNRCLKNYHCEFCGKDFFNITSHQFAAHKTNCKLNPKYEGRKKK